MVTIVLFGVKLVVIVTKNSCIVFHEAIRKSSCYDTVAVCFIGENTHKDISVS